MFPVRKFVAEPFDSGFWQTIGNTRILLSSSG
jgi:hypothetical protein